MPSRAIGSSQPTQRRRFTMRVGMVRLIGVLRLGTVLVGCAAIVGFAAIVGCATNPVTGKSEFSLVSPAQEQQMGAEGNKAVLAEYGVYDDARLQSMVDSV